MVIAYLGNHVIMESDRGLATWIPKRFVNIINTVFQVINRTLGGLPANLV